MFMAMPIISVRFKLIFANVFFETEEGVGLARIPNEEGPYSLWAVTCDTVCIYIYQTDTYCIFERL